MNRSQFDLAVGAFVAIPQAGLILVVAGAVVGGPVGAAVGGAAGTVVGQSQKPR